MEKEKEGGRGRKKATEQGKKGVVRERMEQEERNMANRRERKWAREI